MVLGKLPVLGRPTHLDWSRARAFCTCSRCGKGLFGHFFLSSITSLFFLRLSGLVGWLFLGLTALWDSISVHIVLSPKEKEREDRKDR